jgi:hypothetical protein
LSKVSSTSGLYYLFVRLLCLLLLGLPAAAAPYVRWIDEKGDIHVDTFRDVVAESPAEVQIRLSDGSQRVVRMARVLDLVREDEEQEEQRKLLDARRDVAAGMRLDAARALLDGLAADGSQPWIRESAAAARALLADRAREKDALERLQRFLADYPRSPFQSECILAAARVRGRAHGGKFEKATNEMRVAHDRIVDLEGPILLRFRTLADATELVMPYQPFNFTYFFAPTYDTLFAETQNGKDYGAYVLLEASARWGLLIVQKHLAAMEEAAGRPPRACLESVRKLQRESGLDLPEVRSDVERELGRLMLACGDREGARGAWERARDLAPDPRRREAAEDALRKLAKE